MEIIFIKIGNVTRSLIDFFYAPFGKYMNLQFFRYAATGCINLVFDWTIYFIIYNFVLDHQMVVLGFITLSSHIAALGIKIPIILVWGFMTQKYITFNDSKIRKRVQLGRYIAVFLVNLMINYVGLKLLVDYYGFFPTPSTMIISVFTIATSYFLQKYYIFKFSPDTGIDELNLND